MTAPKRKWQNTLTGTQFGSFNPGTPGPESNRPARRHVIAIINFSTGKPTAQAPTLCVCGWQGVSAEWDQHRREAP